LWTIGAAIAAQHSGMVIVAREHAGADDRERRMRFDYRIG
jgi:hypothetical protein